MLVRSTMIYLYAALASILAQTPGDLKSLVPYLGIPGVMLLIALWLLHKRYVYLRGEVERIEAFWLARYQFLEKLWDEEKADSGRWRDIALRGTELADTALVTAKTAAAKLPEVK